MVARAYLFQRRLYLGENFGHGVTSVKYVLETLGEGLGFVGGIELTHNDSVRDVVAPTRCTQREQILRFDGAGRHPCNFP
jgi:hypothetical protein